MQISHIFHTSVAVHLLQRASGASTIHVVLANILQGPSLLFPPFPQPTHNINHFQYLTDILPGLHLIQTTKYQDHHNLQAKSLLLMLEREQQSKATAQRKMAFFVYKAIIYLVPWKSIWWCRSKVDEEKVNTEWIQVFSFAGLGKSPIQALYKIYWCSNQSEDVFVGSY